MQKKQQTRSTNSVVWRHYIIIFTAAALLCACSGDRARVGMIAPDDSASLTLMQFDWPLDMDKLPVGWSHATFKRHEPMEVSFVMKDGRQSARLSTQDTASMLFRQVDVPIDTFPWLSWEWMIEQGIDIEYDETAASGDDHAARIYLTFENSEGERNSAQLVWGGLQLEPGDWKHLSYLGGLIGPYSHYVVNGGLENTGNWYRERVDLRYIYRQSSGSTVTAKLVEIALFSDTDETGVSSIAYFGPISVFRF
jgi:hypothetical protein